VPEIAVFGQWDTANLGDRAIHESVLRFCAQCGWDAASYSIGALAPVTPRGTRDAAARRGTGALFRAAPPLKRTLRALRRRRRLAALLAPLARADAILVGGGQLLADRNLHFPQSLAMIAWAARRLGKPLWCLGCGTEAVWSPRGESMIRGFLQACAVVAARDDETEVAHRLDEGVDVLLRREAADVQRARRLLGRSRLVRDADAVRDHDGLDARGADRRRDRLRDADHASGAAQERADERGPAARQLDVGEAARRAGAVQRDDVRLAGEARDGGRQQPVRVDEIRTPGRTPDRDEHREQEQRRRPGPAAQIPRHPAAVGEPEVAVGAGGDDLDLHPALSQALDRVGHEAPRELALRPGPRRGEDDDAHRAIVAVRLVRRREWP